jgi:hypothetical protein
MRHGLSLHLKAGFRHGSRAVDVMMRAESLRQFCLRGSAYIAQLDGAEKGNLSSTEPV